MHVRRQIRLLGLSAPIRGSVEMFKRRGGSCRSISRLPAPAPLSPAALHAAGAAAAPWPPQDGGGGDGGVGIHGTAAGAAAVASAGWVGRRRRV